MQKLQILMERYVLSKHLALKIHLKTAYFLFLLSFLSVNFLNAQTTITEKIIASDGEAEDYFGNAVSISGDNLVVGAYSNNGIMGAVYIYDSNGDGSWSNEQKLFASDSSLYAGFGYSVSLSDKHLVVGTKISESVYLYEKNINGEWIDEQIITASDVQDYDRFGNTVSIYGDYLAVGSQNTAMTSFTGSVYVYQKLADGTWGNEQKITASDGNLYDRFSYSIALSDNHLVVGAKDNNSMGSKSGSVYVYERDSNGVWGNEQKLSAYDGEENDEFGCSVSISGDYLVVGSIRADATGVDSGAAYIFRKNSAGIWVHEQKLTANDLFEYDLFGASVSISGGLIVVGSYRDDDKGIGSGSTYLYRKGDNGLWAEDQKFLASDGSSFDEFGKFVNISEGNIAIGAAWDDDLGEKSGSVYTISVKNTTNTFEITPTKAWLYQNQPNPFQGETMISFELVQSGTVSLRLSDITGRVIQNITGDYQEGLHTIQLKDLNTAGVYYYTLEVDGFIDSKKMIVIDQ